MAGGIESDLTEIKWNSKVPFIIASCTTNGKTFVFDIRKQKPVGMLQDHNKLIYI